MRERPQRHNSNVLSIFLLKYRYSKICLVTQFVDWYDVYDGWDFFPSRQVALSAWHYDFMRLYFYANNHVTQGFDDGVFEFYQVVDARSKRGQKAIQEIFGAYAQDAGNVTSKLMLITSMRNRNVTNHPRIPAQCGTQGMLEHAQEARSRVHLSNSEIFNGQGVPE